MCRNRHFKEPEEAVGDDELEEPHGRAVRFFQSPLQKSYGLSFAATSGGIGVEEVVGGVGYKRLMTDVI